VSVAVEASKTMLLLPLQATITIKITGHQAKTTGELPRRKMELKRTQPKIIPKEEGKSP